MAAGIKGFVIDGCIRDKGEIAELIEKSSAISKMEEVQIADIASGKGLSKPWLDKKLEEIGCEYI